MLDDLWTLFCFPHPTFPCTLSVFYLSDGSLFFCPQRIPKEVVSALNIPKSGNVILTIEGGNDKEASYYTCTDGRVCLRAGWQAFSYDNELDYGCDILLLFSKDDDDNFVVSFDVL